MAEPVAISASYVIENDVRFKQALAQAREVISDFRVPYGLISRDFYRSERAIFQLKGPGQYPAFKNSVRASSLGGGTGQGSRRRSEVDISKSPYQKRKLRKFGFDYPLLVATGALAAAATQPNARGSINIITNLSLVLGVNSGQIPYAIYHQSDSPRSKIPLRKFWFIGPEAPRFATSDQVGRLQRWVGYIEDYAVKAFIKSGFTRA
jgi:hypothetical protein